MMSAEYLENCYEKKELRPPAPKNKDVQKSGRIEVEDAQEQFSNATT